MTKLLDQSKRKLLKVASALPVAATLTACGGDSSSDSSSDQARPNLLFILVDQMRYPMMFPIGINSAGEFLQTHMPNTYKLWANGVKFANHIIASTSCGPARSTMVTGLYTLQTWNTATIAGILGNSPPALDPNYPTYGKLLRTAGYATPYIGKWHLSPTPSAGAPTNMSVFGFDGITEMDSLDAANLQGTYGNATASPTPYYNDDYIATLAQGYLANKKTTDQPWCLTVGLQNPHDFQYYPAGTEYKTFANLFASTAANPNGYVQINPYASSVITATINWNTNIFYTMADNAYGYPKLPPNWESYATLNATKPKWQSVVRQYFQMTFGGVSDAPTSTTFSVAQFPNASTYAGYVIPRSSTGSFYGVGLAPHNYWQRGMNAYTLALRTVDESVGKVISALPPEVAKNTIIILTSDHGELAGAHGFAATKSGMFYDEAVRVPLIVSDPTGQFVGDVDVIRTQLTSAIDFLPMLVSFAYGGSTSWMQGDNATLYGQRFNMFPLLKSANASGRSYALFSTDESITDTLDFVTANYGSNGNQTPWHVLGMVTPHAKLGVYSNWLSNTASVNSVGQEYEYYDFATAQGKLELANTYGSAASALMKTQLLTELLPTELQAPLPTSLQSAQKNSYDQLMAYYQTQNTSSISG